MREVMRRKSEMQGATMGLVLNLGYTVGVAFEIDSCYGDSLDGCGM